MAGGDGARGNTCGSIQLAFPFSGRYSFRDAALDAVAATAHGCTNKQPGIFDEGTVACGAVCTIAAD
jgi:hypothetical protein